MLRSGTAGVINQPEARPSVADDFPGDARGEARPAGKSSNGALADCGFLANRNFETGELVSVDEGRQTGRFRTLLGVTYGPMPTCFRMKANLFAEYLTEKSENRLLAVITKDREECAGFVKWEPGFTPKEHREMLFDLERGKTGGG